MEAQGAEGMLQLRVEGVVAKVAAAITPVVSAAVSLTARRLSSNHPPPPVRMTRHDHHRCVIRHTISVRLCSPPYSLAIHLVQPSIWKCGRRLMKRRGRAQFPCLKTPNLKELRVQSYKKLSYPNACQGIQPAVLAFSISFPFSVKVEVCATKLVNPPFLHLRPSLAAKPTIRSNS